MYSVVLMTALVTTSTTPTWFGRSNCCCPPACYSCTYPGCSGCYVPAYGAAGGCYGYHGGCYGAGYGTFYADPNYYHGCTGCYGCYGGHACYGVPVPVVTGGREPVGKDPYPPINPKKDDKGGAEEVGPLKEKEKKKEDKVEPKKDDKVEPKKTSSEEGGSARAKIRIDLPEGGKLYVDGRHINVGAGTRVFSTPTLQAGETYFYDIRIEVEQGGQLRSDQRRVIIRSGQDVAVSFPSLNAPATLAVQVPR